MEAYKELLKEEVELLRSKGKDFLDGKLSRNDFKGFSGGMGCYAQKETGKFMIRLRMPSGVVTKEHFRLVLDSARKNGLKQIHFTTRQAIQLHDLTIDQVCDIMKEAIDHDLFTRGSGGNYPRNVALSPLAGVDREEAFDVTPYARQVGEYFFKNVTSYKLPRKLKVAFSSSPADTGCATINDVGFIGVLHDGRPMFRMWLAGGMGGSPALALPYDELVEPTDVLYYVEAMVRLFTAEGDYENKGRARARFIPRRMGTEAFMKCYKKHLEQVKETCVFEGIEPELSGEIPPVQETGNSRIIPQKQDGWYTVVLHPLCGQLLLEDGETLYEMLSDIFSAELRLSMDEEIYVRNLTKDQAHQLYETMKDRMMTENITMSVSCVGTPTCQTGVNQSQKLCRAIVMKTAGLKGNYLPKTYISGCPNCCSRHPVAGLGFSGRWVKIGEKNVEAFDCYIGGKVGMDISSMGENAGTVLADKIPDMLYELGKVLEDTDTSYADALENGTVKALIKKYSHK